MTTAGWAFSAMMGDGSVEAQERLEHQAAEVLRPSADHRPSAGHRGRRSGSRSARRSSRPRLENRADDACRLASPTSFSEGVSARSSPVFTRPPGAQRSPGARHRRRGACTLITSAPKSSRGIPLLSRGRPARWRGRRPAGRRGARSGVVRSRRELGRARRSSGRRGPRTSSRSTSAEHGPGPLRSTPGRRVEIRWNCWRSPPS